MNLTAKPSVTLVLGSSGTGKSTFVTTYLLRSRFVCRFLFDPMGEWSQRLRLPLAQSVFDLQTAILTGWVCFDPGEMFGGNLSDGFGFYCEFVQAVSKRLEGRKVFCVDEVQDYVSAQSVPEELAVIVQAGRKWELESIFTSQRHNQINGAVLNQFTELVAFNLGSLNDRARLEGYGFDPEELASLPDRHFVSRSRRGGVLRGTV